MLWEYWQDEAGGSAEEKIKWRERFVWFPKHSYLSKNAYGYAVPGADLQ